MSTYVMSDLHGLWDRYEKVKQFIDLKHDTLYVLGDVIDRGKDGIAILEDMMKEANVHLILGNHEWMMLQYYRSLADGKYSLYERLVFEDRWHRNRNDFTKYYFEKLSGKRQKALLTYLEQALLCIGDLSLQQHHFYLVHGSPREEFKNRDVYVYEYIKDENIIDACVWNRMDEQYVEIADRMVITGHTPTCYLQPDLPYQIYPSNEQLEKAKYIDIDCGCACQDAYTQLCLLRLDDLNVFYF